MWSGGKSVDDIGGKSVVGGWMQLLQVCGGDEELSEVVVAFEVVVSLEVEAFKAWVFGLEGEVDGLVCRECLCFLEDDGSGLGGLCGWWLFCVHGWLTLFEGWLISRYPVSQISGTDPLLPLCSGGSFFWYVTILRDVVSCCRFFWARRRSVAR